jgi:hypothetical protein
MREARRSKELGGETIHISDCYVWTEIYYLDSQTCYRECILMHASQGARTGAEFITLDNPWRFSWRAAAKFLVTLPVRLLTWRASLTGKIQRRDPV